MCIWTIFRVKIENPKIRKKGFPKLGEGGRSPSFGNKLAPRPPIGLCPNCPPKPLGGGDMGPQNLKFGPHLPKIGVLLESPWGGLQALKILWAKVHKQRSWTKRHWKPQSLILQKDSVVKNTNSESNDNTPPHSA